MGAVLHELTETARLSSPYMLARFFKLTEVPHKGENLCWEWIGAKDAKGYGQFQPYAGLGIRAHRYSLLVLGGGVSRDLLACHHCDNPGCVNPRHLFAGSALENAHDRDRKGRQVTPRGPAHPSYRITPDAASLIRERSAAGERQRDIAADLKVSQTTVWRVINGDRP